MIDMKKFTLLCIAVLGCIPQGTVASFFSSLRGTSSESIVVDNLSDEQLMIQTILQQDDKDHRTLGDGPPCGILDFPCTNGAVCAPNESRDDQDFCLCDVSGGFINDTAPDDPSIAFFSLQGYRSCIAADECTNQGGTTNVCALEGGGCEDRAPDNGQYMCFCKEGFLAVANSFGEHGPEACEQVNECQVFPDICGDNKICTDTPGSFNCTCREGLIETEVGDCLDSQLAQNLTSCDPSLNDDCKEPERECDELLSKCVCIDGFFQPAGAGGQCQQENECLAQTDVACDRRGRGGLKPRSKCIDRDPIDGDGNPRQGYTCECLPGFIDAANAIRGTNCLEVIEPTPAPITPSPTTSSPVAAVVENIRPLPCTTFVCTAPNSFCAAERNRCECRRGFVQPPEGPFACECPEGFAQSLSTPFACEKICEADTDCPENESCDSVDSRCTACPAGSFREVNSTDGCVDPCNNPLIPDDVSDVSGRGGGPCEGKCESISATAVVCSNCTSNVDCPENLACDIDGECKSCPAGSFREESSAGECMNPCEPDLCESGICVGSSSTEFNCFNPSPAP